MSLWTKQGPSGAIIEQSGTWAYYGGAGTVANMSDASDTSGIKKSSLNAGDSDYVSFPIAVPSFPSNEVFLQSRYRVRMSRPANGVVAVQPGYYTYTLIPGFIPPRYSSIPGYDAITYYSGSLAANDVIGAWASRKYEIVRLYDRTGVLARISSFLECWCDYQTTSVPLTPTVSTTGTFTDTAAPTLSWTHKDLLSASISQRQSAGTTRTITTSTAHGFLVGNDVTVAFTASNGSYDGTYKIVSVPSSTTFTYTASGSLTEGPVAQTGTVSIGDNQPQTAYQAAVYLSYSITNKVLTSNVATLTTSVNHTFQAGQSVYVAIGDPYFDGQWTITAVTANTFSYARTASNVTSAAASGYTRLFTATYDSGIASGTAQTLTAATTLPNGAYRLEVRTGKTVNGATVWSPYGSSTFTVNVPSPALSFTSTWDATNQRTTLAVVLGENLLAAQDAGMETASSTGTWTAQTNCSITQSTTFADTGTGSLRLSSTAAGTMSAITATGVSGAPVVGSQPYAATARFRAGSVARTNTVGITWYDSAGAVISTTTGTGVASTTTGFTTVTVTGTAPANAAFAAVVVTVQSTAAGAELHYVDSIAVHPGSTPNYTPGGLTWTLSVTRTVAGVTETVRTLTAFPSTAILTTYDYECKRGASVSYSAVASGTNAAATVTSTSATVTAAISSTNDGTWWAKAVTAPSLNKGSVRVLVGFNESREEHLGVFRLDGRSDTVVVAGQTFGDDIDFAVFAQTATEWEAIKALFVTYQGTLLLQEPFTDPSGVGRQRWIRVVDRQWSRAGTPARPQYALQCKAVEVGKGY